MSVQQEICGDCGADMCDSSTCMKGMTSMIPWHVRVKLSGVGVTDPCEARALEATARAEAAEAEVQRLRERLYGKRGGLGDGAGRRKERCQKEECAEVKKALSEEKAAHNKTWRQFENFQKTTIKQHAAGEVRRFEAEAVEKQIELDETRKQMAAAARVHRSVESLAIRLDRELTELRAEHAELCERYAALSASWAAEMTQQANLERDRGKRRAKDERSLATALQHARKAADARVKLANEKEREAEGAVARAEKRTTEAEKRAERAEKALEAASVSTQKQIEKADQRTEAAKLAAAEARSKALEAQAAAEEAVVMKDDAERVRMLQERQTERAKATAARLAARVSLLL